MLGRSKTHFETFTYIIDTDYFQKMPNSEPAAVKCELASDEEDNNRQLTDIFLNDAVSLNLNYLHTKIGT